MPHQTSRTRYPTHALLLACVAVVVSPESLAQRDAPAEWNLTLENDMWGGPNSDGHYTHGTRITRLSRNPSAWIERAAARLPCRPCRDLQAVEWRIAQNLYTPEATWRSDRIQDDRPYAGWLYGGIRFLGGTRTDRAYRLDTIGLDLGVIGPSAMAEQAQGLIHNAQGKPSSRGWQHQLEDEAGLVLSYRRQWHHEKRAGRLSNNVAPYVSGALGNVFTHLGAGVSLKTGINFRSHRLAERRAGAGWHVFLDVETRAVARNIFLDGNTYADSHRVEKEPLIAEIRTGFGLTLGRFEFAAMTMIRSREFAGQLAPDRHGALSFTYRP